MSFQLTITPEAEADLASATHWYDEQTAGLGAEFVEAVELTFRSIGTQPRVHAAIYRDVRKAVVSRFPYVVYYRIEADVVAVVAVHHAKRHPRHWQTRV